MDGSTWGGAVWEDQVRSSAATRGSGMVVLVTGAAGFVGSHTSLALKRRGDGVAGVRYAVHNPLAYVQSNVAGFVALLEEIKKADEVLGHTYNHIYGLSITALRFFTVYGPWGRPDMAYFSFTRNIMAGKPIKIFRGPKGEELARDFTFIDDVVKGCVASLDTALPSVGSKGKRRKAQFRVYNLGNTQPVKVGDFVSILEKHLKVNAIRE
ncbi:unnamed protein product [Closterium sp. NIES-64]|nr:unnamed protein product [Closterium sp. NIES-64]